MSAYIMGVWDKKVDLRLQSWVNHAYETEKTTCYKCDIVDFLISVSSFKLLVLYE